jgi:hypothetical protein
LIVEHEPGGRSIADTDALTAITTRPPALIRRHGHRLPTGLYDVQQTIEQLAHLPDPVLLTAADAHRYLGIPAGTVYSWVSRRLLAPLDRTAAGRPLYDVADLHTLNNRSTP